jgi:hypothetical protein
MLRWLSLLDLAGLLALHRSWVFVLSLQEELMADSLYPFDQNEFLTSTSNSYWQINASNMQS